MFIIHFAQAQTFPLQIQVSVMPPYSAYLQDYPGTGQQVRVFIINTSRSTYQVRLTGHLTSDNGIEIRTSPNYRPPRPVTVPPGQTLLTRNDLEGLFDLNQIEVTGIDKNLLARGFPLPDGTYQLCVRAYNATATNTAAVAFGQPLSAEFPIGCSAPISIKSVEPPILISPLCDAEMTATTPQAVVFTWTPPVGVSPASVEYTLRVVELPQVDIDPNVYIDALVLPKSGVEVHGLRTSTFLYGPTQPPLIVGKRYAWRVQAIDRSRRLNFLNDGKSPVCAFTYGKLTPLANVVTVDKGRILVSKPKKCGDTLSAGINNDLLLAWKLTDSVRTKLMNVALAALAPKEAEQLKKNPALLLNQFPNTYYQFTLKTDKSTISRELKNPFFQMAFDSLGNTGLTPGKTYDFTVSLILPDAVREKAGLGGLPVEQTCSFKLIRKDRTNGPSLLVKGTLAYRFPGNAQTYSLPQTRVRLFYVPAPSMITSSKTNGGNNLDLQTNNGLTASTAQVAASQIKTSDKKKSSDVSSSQVQQNPSTSNTNAIELAASVETDGLGMYTFTVKNYLGQVGTLYTGDSTDVLRHLEIRVENPYFQAPDGYVKLPVGSPKTYDVPTITLLARSYNLLVKAHKTYKNWPNVKNDNIDGQVVMLFRSPPNHEEGLKAPWPPVEGMADNSMKFNPLMLSAMTSAVDAATTGSQSQTAIVNYLLTTNTGETGSGNSSSKAVSGDVATPIGNTDGVFQEQPKTEGQAQADLESYGNRYVASGRLKVADDGSFTIRFSQLFYRVSPGDVYFMYCPNLNQSPDDAVAVSFSRFQSNGNPKSIVPDSAQTETYAFDILSPTAPVATFKGRVIYQYPDPNDGTVPNMPPNTPKPLGGVDVKLIVTYVLKNTLLSDGKTIGNRAILGSDELDDAINGGLITTEEAKDNLKVLDMQTTDENGNFVFQAALDKPYKLGLLKKNYEAYTGYGEFRQKKTGDLYRTLRVWVVNNYYVSPSGDYGDDPSESLQPLASYDLKTLSAGVTSYAMTTSCVSANVPGSILGAGKPLQKIDVYILRPVNPDFDNTPTGRRFGPPLDEGQNLNQKLKDTKSGKQYYIVGKGQTGGDGTVKFNRLVSGSDYMFAALSNITGQAATKDKLVGVGQTLQAELEAGKGIVISGTYKLIPDYPLFVSDFSYYSITNTYSLKPALPRVTLRVRDQTQPTKGIPGVTVVMNGAYHYTKTVTKEKEGWLGISTGQKETVTTQETKALSYTALTDDNGNVSWTDLPEMTNVTLHISKKGWLGIDDHNDVHNVLDFSIPGGLSLGQNYYNDGILLMPNGLVTGRSVEKGNKQPVVSYVQVGRKGVIVETDAGGYFIAPVAYNPNGFPTGDSLIVHPKNVTYFETALPQKSFKAAGPYYIQSFDNVLISTVEHRIKFRVFADKNFQKPISMATAYLLGDSKLPIGTSEGYADASSLDGTIQGHFKNVSVQNLFMEIRAQGYVSKKIAFQNAESVNFVDLGNFYLEPAETIVGTVVVKDQGKETPQPGAEVFLNAGINGEVFSTTTTAQGSFSLSVPQYLSGNTVTLHATYADPTNKSVHVQAGDPKPGVYAPKTDIQINTGSTYVGDDEKLAIPQAKGGAVKLVLTTFDKFKINSLWGFPIKIRQLTTDGTGAKVAGELILDDKKLGPFQLLNPDFKVTFENVSFIPDPNNAAVGIPKLSEVSLMSGEIPMAVYTGKEKEGSGPLYNIKLFGTGKEGRFVISRDGDKKGGIIRAKAQIVDNSFTFPSTLLSYNAKDQFFLNDPGMPGADASSPMVIAFDGRGGAVKRDMFDLSRADGQAMSFKLIEFNSTSQPQKSKLAGKEIWIAPDMVANIPDAQPSSFTASVEKIVLTSKDVDAQGGNGPLTFKLGGKWSVEINNWRLDYKQGGFYYDSLSAKTLTSFVRTQKIDMPISMFNLRHDMLVLRPSVSKTIPLAGVADLTVLGQTYFGYDTHTGSDQAGHWSMVIVPAAGQPAARLVGGQLNGLPIGSNLDFELFSLLDNGEDVLSFGGKTPSSINYYNVINFTPSSVDSGKDYFALVGGLKSGIPRVSQEMPVRMVYTQKGKAPSLAFPEGFSFEGKGYVQYQTSLKPDKNPDIGLADGVLAMRGTVMEPGELNPMNVLLVHTKNFTRITHDRTVDLQSVDALSQLKVEANLIKDDWQYKPAFIPVDNAKKFDQAYCAMRVDPAQKDWDLLTFSGIPSGFDGMKPTRMPFVVHGEIVANSNEVGMKDIELGPTKMSLVYEIAKSRLTGSLVMTKPVGLDGGMSFQGAAQMRLDGNGFYIAASGVVTDVPIIVPVTMKAGIMLGYYASKDFQDANGIIFQYTHRKEYPCSFTDPGFKGFFVTGEIPIPKLDGLSVDIDLGIASAGLKVQAYVDGYMFGTYNSGVVTLAGGARTDAEITAYAHLPALSVDGYMHMMGSLDIKAQATGNPKFKLGYDYKMSNTLKVKGSLDLGITSLSAELPVGFCFLMNGAVTVGPLSNDGPHLDFNLSSDGCSTACQQTL